MSYRSHRSLHSTSTGVAEGSDDTPTTNNTTDDIDTLPINYHWTKQNLQIALPALIGMLADPLLSLMDTIYVGKVGTTELAALGACTSIFHLAFNAFRATTAATTTLVASKLSTSNSIPITNETSTEVEALEIVQDSSTTTIQDQGNNEDAKAVTSVSLQLGFWLGTAVMMVLLLFGNKALASMGIPSSSSELYPAASQYLFTRCWAAPVVLLIGVSEGAFRGYGDTVVPLLASLCAALMNIVLDPLFMFVKPFNMGVRGAAAATALSQVGALVVYMTKLFQRNMLPPIRWPRILRRLRRRKTDSSSITGTKISPPERPRRVIRTILGANLSMLVKQGSLLLGWAFATARATRLGSVHVAAHQVALSVWLVFALILDGTAVSAQVLMSRAYLVEDDEEQTKSLISYMSKFALVQGLVSMLILDGLDWIVPRLFTSDAVIQGHLHKVMPHLATQQVLVSATLVMESLAAGANQFGLLAMGTTISTIASVWQLRRQTSVDGIWSIGISTLFVGRFLTAIVACVRARLQQRKRHSKEQQQLA